MTGLKTWSEQKNVRNIFRMENATLSVYALNISYDWKRSYTAAAQTDSVVLPQIFNYVRHRRKKIIMAQQREFIYTVMKRWFFRINSDFIPIRDLRLSLSVEINYRWLYALLDCRILHCAQLSVCHTKLPSNVTNLYAIVVEFSFVCVCVYLCSACNEYKKYRAFF